MARRGRLAVGYGAALLGVAVLWASLPAGTAGTSAVAVGSRAAMALGAATGPPVVAATVPPRAATGRSAARLPAPVPLDRLAARVPSPTPPTPARCEARFGIACYSPAQLQRT
jgi:hypothetical protein